MHANIYDDSNNLFMISGISEHSEMLKRELILNIIKHVPELKLSLRNSSDVLLDNAYDINVLSTTPTNNFCVVSILLVRLYRLYRQLFTGYIELSIAPSVLVFTQNKSKEASITALAELSINSRPVITAYIKVSTFIKE